MIIFQLTLSGHQLRALVAVRETDSPWNRLSGVPDHWMSSSRALIREGLVTHESPCDCKKATKHVYRETSMPYPKPRHFHQAGRRWPFEITEKGELALQIAAHDLHDFLQEISQVRISAPKTKSVRRAVKETA